VRWKGVELEAGSQLPCPADHSGTPYYKHDTATATSTSTSTAASDDDHDDDRAARVGHDERARIHAAIAARTTVRYPPGQRR
jgi:hypothetical protein